MSGRILYYINGINLDIISEPELIINYIMHLINTDLEKLAYENYMAKMTMIMASNSYCENPIPFSEIRQSIYNPKKVDNRSAEEIIKDTLKKHNIKVKED